MAKIDPCSIVLAAIFAGKLDGPLGNGLVVVDTGLGAQPVEEGLHAVRRHRWSRCAELLRDGRLREAPADAPVEVPLGGTLQCNENAPADAPVEAPLSESGACWSS